MSRISRLFFQGLAAVLPITVSLAAIFWLANKMERGLGSLFQLLLPKAYYIYGMGMAAGIVLLLVVGILMESWLIKKFFSTGEKLLAKIPLLKTIYGGVQDLLGFFNSEKNENDGRSVVMVEVVDGLEVIGFVTRNDLTSLSEGIAPDVPEGEDHDTVAVYLPMSYQIGGYTVFISRKRLREVDMKVEDAMRFAVTAGMSTGAAPQ